MSTYLWVNLSAVFFPLLFSFDRKVAFYKKWKFLFPAITASGILFVIWDVLFTSWSVWGFNSMHIMKIRIINLPIEEIFFFITVPYSSVFTYEVLNVYIKNDLLKPIQKTISIVLILMMVIVLFIFPGKIYTLSAFFLNAFLIFILEFVIEVKWLSRFYFAYLIILLPFSVVNGVLTGSFIKDEVVWYNNLQILGVRIFTIPIEDIFYGMILILMNISIYEYLKSRK